MTKRDPAKKKEYDQQYCLQNQEAIRARHKAYYEANRDAIVVRQKAYYETNRENLLIQSRQYREEHRAELGIQEAIYREKNREALRITAKAYRRANPEKVKAKNAAYYQKNRDALRAKRKIYREANREERCIAAKRWQENNPDKYAAIHQRSEHRRRARLANVSGEYTQEQWYQILTRYGMACAKCGRSLTRRSATVDHFVPIVAGGPNCAENLQPLCKSCNSRKHTRIPTFEEQLAFIARRKALGLPAALIAEVL